MPSIDKKVIQLKNTADELLDPIPALASPTRTGGVMPETKTSAMTQAVGMDSTGKLFTTPAPSDLTYEVVK